MKKIDLTKYSLDNKQEIYGIDEYGNEYVEIFLYNFQDANGIESYALQDAEDKKIDFPEEIYCKEDFRNEKDQLIFQELFDCIYYTDNGITNYLSFDENGICENNDELCRDDFEEFFEHFDKLESAIIEEEDEIGVCISFLLWIDRKDFI